MANTHSISLSDSNNSYLSIASSGNFNLLTTNDRTFEAWVRVNTTKANAGIFVRWGNEGGGNKNFLCRLTGTRAIQVYAGSGSSTGANVTSSGTLSLSTWHHVAVTWSGSTDDKFRIYIDGTLDATLSGTASPGSSTSSLVIGGEANLSGVDSDIQIDDVRIWDTQRTQSEIDTNKAVELDGTETGLLEYWKLNNDLTNSVSGGGTGTLTNNNSATFSTDVGFTGSTPTNPGTTNLVSYWSLEEASGTRVDAHGSNDLTDGNTVGQGTGIVSNCADFESTNSEFLRKTSPTSLPIANNFSISLWVNPESLGTNLWISEMSDGADNNAMYRLFKDTTNKVQFGISNGSGSYNTATTTTTLSASTWYHLVCVKRSTGTGVEIYLNGSSEGTNSFTGSAPTGGTQYFTMSGRRDPINLPFDGLIDEFCIFDDVLTDAEISWLYNSGSGRSYTDITGGGGGGGTATSQAVVIM